MTRRPLTSRPLDFIYFSFFLIHIPASIAVDLQAIYRSLVPEFAKQIIPLYLSMSADPLMAGAMNITDTKFTWFRSFVWLELLFQFPVFILGARALWKDSPSIYLLLLIYGASTSTTTLACVTTILATPRTTNPAMAIITGGLTDGQRAFLLASYVPFLLVPLVMTLDMAWRVSNMLDFNKGARVDTAARAKKKE